MKVWYNKKINLISWICIFECLHGRVQISFQNEWLGKTFKNCNKVLKTYQRPFVFIWPISGITRALHKERKCKYFSRRKRAMVFFFLYDIMSDSQADCCNLILHIHYDCCRLEMLVSHFEMFAVKVRWAVLFSSLETSSSFEEEVPTTFAEGQSVHTHCRQWLVATSLHSSFRK